MIIMVWLDPRCAADENLDKRDLYRTNYEATKLAISRAMKGEPTIDELDQEPQDHHAITRWKVCSTTDRRHCERRR